MFLQLPSNISFEADGSAAAQLQRYTRGTMRRRIALALWISSLASCQLSQPCSNMKFERFDGADRIEITDSTSRSLRIISNKHELQEFAAFAKAHDSDWATPVTGTPVAKVRANFYSGERFLGDLGVGSDFLTAQGCGYFQSRTVSQEDRQVIMKLFGVLDPYAAE
ncbi:hypothetical protein [Frateuria sp.]|uniref:hypothetical protein n=1 Tax=Frateuria sp. TaxID=2211372 RepID=UPI003F80FE38